ncbi:hypothetical protein [Dictyobacter aurantiacus]|uniref:HAMP domain-containing protein n=1 Tax=Dictyobacter aurantiacus TaxID=1936993 RepID=A0A401ZT11_9CHLR|nr:hypothetical protein [Dictyobacter aurantiacus]GCE09926.1 hypothetical protein KDAU_72550 [Dictyobacter aurantiacus]
MSRDASGLRTGQHPSRSQANIGPASVINQEPQKDTSLLRWWYRFTAPAPVSADATLQQRDLSRRGRLTSFVLLMIILLVLAAEPAAIFGPNKALIFILLIPVFIDIVALVFNKLGKLMVAGILVVIGIEVGLILSILGPALGSGGLTTYVLPQFDLFVQAEFVSVTLLDPRSVFVVTFFNIAFTVLSILYLPHTAEFAAVLAANPYDIFLRPITLAIIVAGVLFVAISSLNQTLKRADRAEVVAELERREVERQQQDISLKQQLEQGTQAILQTHVEVANGNFTARAPLTQDNVLWRISLSLNNLIARLQSSSQAEAELERAKAHTAQLVDAIRKARAGRPVQLHRTGTHLDAIIVELQTGMRQPIDNTPASTQGTHMGQSRDRREQPKL